MEKNTETGVPVKYYEWQSNGQGHWKALPAVIQNVNGPKVSILVLGEKNKLIENVKHADFLKEGQDYWDFLDGKGEYSSLRYLSSETESTT